MYSDQGPFVQWSPEAILIKCQELSECTVIGEGSDPIGW